MDLCNQADFNFRQASNKQFLIELTLIKLCQLLSPSPDEGGDDGGRLKPLESGRVAASEPTQATVTPQAATARQPMPPTAPKTTTRAYTASAPKPARTAEPSATFSPGSLSLGSLRNLGHKATDTHAPVEANAKQQRREAYSDADIASAWPRAVAATKPGPMLSSLLGNAVPERSSADAFTLRVSSEMEAEIMAKALGDVQRNVRDILQNDFITFAPLVSATELPKHLWTDDKVLEDIISAHPGVKHLIDKYQLRRN